MSWIAVDLDGTLAHFETWGDGSIGAPIPLMVSRVKRWLSEGKDVRIFTARVALLKGAYSMESGKEASQEFVEEQTQLIQDWCEEHIGARLPVTCVKDFFMLELWDDRAVGVVMNTGEIIGGG